MNDMPRHERSGVVLTWLGRQASLTEQCSKAVQARSSRVDSRASHRSRKREAWSVSVTVSPPSTMVWVGETKELRALSRDRSRRRVEHDLTFHWQIVEGLGALAGMHNQAHRKAHRS
jgi:hypothetical protein